MSLASLFMAKNIFEVLFDGKIFVDIISRTDTLICFFVLPIGFLIFWFFERFAPKYYPKKKNKNFLAKLLLLDIKSVVPNYFVVCNIIAFVATILFMIASIVHLFVLSGITSGIFRISILVYMVALLIQTFSLFKYNYLKK